MKKILTLLPLLALSLSLFAQADSNTLEDQFVDVIDKSNRYEDYKVVKIYKLNNLKNSVLDSVSALEATIDGIRTEIARQATEIDTLKSSLTQTQEDLRVSQAKEDGISFFGSITKKSTYNTIMWSIIGLLVLALVLLFLRFKSSHSLTRAAQLKLSETEEEYEGYRQRTLEREQQLRRKLQDEINKQKKV